MLTDLKGQCNVVSFAVAHVIHDTISVPALQIDKCNGRGLVDQWSLCWGPCIYTSCVLKLLVGVIFFLILSASTTLNASTDLKHQMLI